MRKALSPSRGKPAGWLEKIILQLRRQEIEFTELLAIPGRPGYKDRVISFLPMAIDDPFPGRRDWIQFHLR